MRWPGGVVSAGVACGIKASGVPDLGIMVVPDETRWAGTFTTNPAAAAPVGWCRDHLGAPVRALVVNSGNANACTGSAGREVVRSAAMWTAGHVGCDADQVLVASTGPIGVPLDETLIEKGIARASRALGPESGDFARAILTTDTYPKVASANAGGASVVGAAKGAAMLAPNMATMLAFIVTDAQLEGDLLQAALSDAVERSFNRLCTDACESTNDTVIAFATGSVEADPRDVRAALGSVCAELSLKIARDAEGGSKLVRIEVAGAHDEAAAVSMARAVASSALWRSAAGGADPNWGRVDGPGTAQVLSSDLTCEYVRLNAGGLT